MSEMKNDARLNFRINSELKKTIEDAAAQTGQTVSDFAVSTLIQVYRKILLDEHATCQCFSVTDTMDHTWFSSRRCLEYECSRRRLRVGQLAEWHARPWFRNSVCWS